MYLGNGANRGLKVVVHQNSKLKIGIQFSALNICCKNKHWSQCFNPVCWFSSAKVIKIVRCFLNIVSKIRQICIISARFCGWKCALVAPINVNLTVKVEWLFRFRFRLFTNNISCYNQNISHDVTDCTFCDWKMNWSVSLAKFLSHIENITVEKTEDIKRIEIDRTDPCLDKFGGVNY